MDEKKPLILIVDDEQDFLDIFGTKLRSSGFDVVGALNGQDLLDHIKEINPDLILLDVNMPGMSGLETLEKLKSNPSTADAKVVFLTALGEPLPVKELLENDKRFALEIGATDYIRKSDDLDSIVNAVRIALERAKNNHAGAR